MTRREVATYFGVTERTISRWEKEGKLDTVKLGGRTVRYREETIMDLVENSAIDEMK